MAVRKKSHTPLACLIDLILITLFSLVGHYTHSKNFIPAEIWDTAWPFIAALAVSWILNAIWADPILPLRTGVGVWGTTILIALVIRSLTGESNAPAFIVISSVLNFITLVGWRMIVRLMLGRRA